jgi:1-deoxy-D-xylulose-5-phosphate synthase
MCHATHQQQSRRYPRGSGLGLDLAAYGIGPDMKGTPMELGKSLLRREGTAAALVGYGSSVNECMAAAEMLAREGVEVTVCDARFCKPLDTLMVCTYLLGVETPWR